MKKLLLFILLWCSPAFAQQTIDQLSAGTTIAGTELLPMFQTANPAVTTTPSAINTYIVGKINNFVTGQIINGTLRLGTVSSVTGQLLLANSASANLTTIQAGNAAAARTYTWPTNFGAAGSILSDASGNGTLSWLTVLPVANGGTNCSSATITCFNNITGFTAAGTTGTTSTNLVFSTSPTLVTPVLGVATGTSLALGGCTISTNAFCVTGTTALGATTITGSFTATGLVTNADLANAATTVNGQTCTLGSTCTVAAAAGTLTGATLAAGVTASSLTSTGALATGSLATGFVIGGVTMTLGSDATGDIYYRNSSGVLTRLAVCTGTNVIGASGGLPACVAQSGGSGITIGTTTITSGTTQQILYNNAGVVGEITKVNSGVLITSGAGVPSIATTLPSALTIPSPTVTGVISIPAGSAAAPSLSVGVSNSGIFEAFNGVGISVAGVDKFDCEATVGGNCIFFDTLNMNLNTISNITTLQGTSGGSASIIITTNEAASGIIFKTAVATTALTLDSSQNATFVGSLTATLANTATTSAVCYNTSTKLLTYDGTLGTCTVSALRFKDLIGSLDETSGLNNLRSAIWTYKPKAGFADEYVHVGLLADDVEIMDKRCVVYDNDGQLLNYDDRCILAYLVADRNKLVAEINALKTMILSK